MFAAKAYIIDKNLLQLISLRLRWTADTRRKEEEEEEEWGRERRRTVWITSTFSNIVLRSTFFSSLYFRFFLKLFLMHDVYTFLQQLKFSLTSHFNFFP